MLFFLFLVTNGKFVNYLFLSPVSIFPIFSTIVVFLSLIRGWSYDKKGCKYNMCYSSSLKSKEGWNAKRLWSLLQSIVIFTTSSLRLSFKGANQKLFSQGMQGARDFTEHLLGDVGAAAPLQATVTDAWEIKLSDSSHDTFAGNPCYS